jgi:hypothetical protein
MKQSTKRFLGGLAIAAGALGAIGAIVMKRKSGGRRKRRAGTNTWARPGMKVIFRAELMPGRDASERTFHVTELLPSGRVLLDRVAGEHAEKEFEPLRSVSARR